MLLSTLKLKETSLETILNYANESNSIVHCNTNLMEDGEYEVTLLVESQKEIINMLDALITYLKDCTN